jgi:hypothetical protein
VDKKIEEEKGAHAAGAKGGDKLAKNEDIQEIKILLKGMQKTLDGHSQIHAKSLSV